MSLNTLSDEKLLQFYCKLMEELRQRKLVRSSNNPVSDYAEKITCEKMNLIQEQGSNKGYDAVDERKGIKYQIKARRLTSHNKSRQLGVIRNLDQKLFDYLIAVIFDENFSLKEIWKIPHEKIKEYARHSEHQNGYILILNESILKDKAITKLL